MSLSVEIILDFMAIQPTIAWQLIRQSHLNELPDSADCSFRGSKCKIRNVPRMIIRSGKPHFGVKFQEGEIHYGHLANYKHSLVWIRHNVKNLKDAEVWVTPFIGSNEFREAWVYEDEYDKWQNAKDPLEYEAAGKSYEGLPMKSNNLPYPLEMMEIDISNNPGRRIIRQGYVEAVGAMMWFGNSFWQLTGVNKENIKIQDWLKFEETSSGVNKIQAFDESFTSAEGIQGELQNRLRTLLFPVD